MAATLLKGVLIGLVFGLPVGAVGAMAVQRAWSSGARAGLLTGLGSSVADCLYASVGAFGLSLVSDFLLRYQTVIQILGGSLLLWMGIRLLGKEQGIAAAGEKPLGGGRMFFSSFAVGITNPAAILTFLFAFSYFGITDVSGPLEGGALAAGVFLGTTIWWGTLTAAVLAVKRRTGGRSFRCMNQVFGGILILFGAVVFLRLLV